MWTPAREDYLYFIENQSFVKSENFFQKNSGFKVQKLIERKTIYIDNQLFASWKTIKNNDEKIFCFQFERFKTLFIGF